MKGRRRARVLVLQSLFEIDLTGHDPSAVLQERFNHTNLPPAGQAFAQRLLYGVLSNRKSLDQLIAHYAPEWPIEQMAVIDRNILRMALYEIAAEEETPLKVAINEAIELAKMFGSDSSPRFVNGVLGSIVEEKGQAGLAQLISKAEAPKVSEISES